MKNLHKQHLWLVVIVSSSCAQWEAGKSIFFWESRVCLCTQALKSIPPFLFILRNWIGVAGSVKIWIWFAWDSLIAGCYRLCFWLNMKQFFSLAFMFIPSNLPTRVLECDGWRCADDVNYANPIHKTMMMILYIPQHRSLQCSYFAFNKTNWKLKM